MKLDDDTRFWLMAIGTLFIIIVLIAATGVEVWRTAAYFLGIK